VAIEIEQVDTTTAPEALLAELHDHYTLVDAEVRPDDPPMPFEARKRAWRHIVNHRDIRRWVLRDDGAIVAVAVVLMDTEDDLNNGFARIHVLPEKRRRGLASLLAAPVLDALEDGKRGSVITDTFDNAPWEAELERLGMKKSFQSRLSRLLVADVDWDLMGAWVARASERAADYDVERVGFPIEEELLSRWCDVRMVMNTAPREGLDFEDYVMTPRKWRDIEAKESAKGMSLAACVAVHKPTGEWVGLSEITFNEAQPEQAEQGDTGVHPDHRNMGLGRWLKATTIQGLVADHPEVERIDTDNAESNDAMLSINVEMGYREILQECAWQGDTKAIRENLRRPASAAGTV